MSDVSDKKAINLTDLQRFKEKNDAKTEKKIAKAKNDLICEINAISFDPQHNIPVFDDTTVRKVIETKPNQLIIHTSGYTDMYACPSRTWNEYASHDTCDYIQSEEDNGTVYVRYFKFRYNSGSYYCDASCTELGGYYDFDEADLTNQTKLAEVYNLCPATLRVHTNTDGLQFYRLQNNDKTQTNQIVYSCLLSGMLIEFGITESDGTYLINVIRYALTPVSQ